MASSQDTRHVLARYLREIRGRPLLTRTEERQLVRELREGSEQALHRLVESNLGFVVHVAKQYRSLGLPFEDLLNEGNLGLIEAAKRFDETKGTKFITYAIWWIRKSILRALSEKAPLIRVPYNQARKVGEVRRAAARLTVGEGREPTREEIADHLRMAVGDVERALTLGSPEVRIDSEPEGDSRPLSDFLEAVGLSTEERLIEEQTLDELLGAFRGLTGRQRTVLGLRFGLTGGTPLTLRAIGEAVHLSRERVRQIEREAMRRLRRTLLARSSISAGARGRPPPRRTGSRSEKDLDH